MKIAMLGMGAYAIALTKVLYKAKNDIVMWSKFEDEVRMIKEKRENSLLLPGIRIEDDIAITNDLKLAVNKADIIVMAVPVMAIREVCSELSNVISKEQIICIVSKGIENKSQMFPVDIIKEQLPECDKICMISGPSFASELANYAQTGITIASNDPDVIIKTEKAFKCDSLCFDVTDDVLGVEICSTIKNIYAILLGILSGNGMSESTKASTLAVIINDSRAILEILGGNRRTAYMYAGLGDLLLTTMSSKSRNFTLGFNIGQGLSSEEALRIMSTKTVEGLHSLQSIYNLLKNKNENIKSIDLLYDIIYNKANFQNILMDIS